MKNDDTIAQSGADSRIDLGGGDRAMPSRIGAYRILAELGSGGMGTVFLAEQTEPVQRTVALKVMRSHVFGPEGRLRFETERQAMAWLQHPNIAQIFEAGATEEGHPYFAMERVDGEPITTYCARTRLTVEQRLALFRTVCDGIQHAHQKGIIHRDLKPSNILVAEVDGRPVAKIIDFGIAKTFGHDTAEASEAEASDLEVSGEHLIGTPAYLSPEAAEWCGENSDLDTRSDVYSLGILLCELLVGCRPFDDASENVFQVLQRIVADDPVGPSTLWGRLSAEKQHDIASRRRLEPAALRKQLRGDLDWIVLKAIAKDRSERYDSAAALGADLARHLCFEPVEAGPSTRRYRVGKFVRRRAGTVAAVGAIILALGFGLVARTLEAHRANREAAAAIGARLGTEEALRAAERARAEADEVSKFLTDLFRVSDPGEAKGNSVTARELLDDAAVKVRTGFEDQPLARARFMQEITDIYRKLGLYEQALDLSRESLALRRKHLAADHPDIAESLNGLAALHAQMGRFADAEPLLRESLAIRQARLRPNDLRIAGSLNNLANLVTDLGRPTEAEQLYVEAIAIARLHEGEPTADQLVALNNLAAFYSEEERYEEAEPLLREFLDRVRAEHGDRHPYVAFALENLAELRRHQGAATESEALYRQAEAILLEVLGDDHPEFAYCLSSRADLYAELGRVEEAKGLYLRAQAIQQQTLPPDHPELQSTLEGLAALR